MAAASTLPGPGRFAATVSSLKRRQPLLAKMRADLRVAPGPGAGSAAGPAALLCNSLGKHRP